MKSSEIEPLLIKAVDSQLAKGTKLINRSMYINKDPKTTVANDICGCVIGLYLLDNNKIGSDHPAPYNEAARMFKINMTQLIDLNRGFDQRLQDSTDNKYFNLGQKLYNKYKDQITQWAYK